MLKTCKYCGIVPEDHICPHKRAYKEKDGRQSNTFRKSNKWTEKSIEIRQRDRYLCRVCENNLYNTIRQINYKSLEVHHIIPINEDYNKRLDNDNLITLCTYHHHMADRGEIPKKELQSIIDSPPGENFKK